MSSDEGIKNGSGDGDTLINTEPSNWQKRLHFVIFMMMGYGANWVFATALAQEIPFFELTQPEGLCIATYMNASTNFGVLMMCLYTFVNKNIMSLSYHYAVPSLLTISAVGSFFAAATYSITINNVSALLYISCAIGGTVGSLASVIFNPFMTAYENDMISAARSGGSALILLTAFVAMSQGPGTANRFSVAVYLSIFGVLLIFPIISYGYIKKSRIGLRRKRTTSAEEIKFMQDPEGFEMGATAVNPLKQNHRTAQSRNESANLSIESDNNNLDDEKSVQRMLNYKSNNPIDIYFDRIIAITVPDAWQMSKPWLRRAMPYMFAVGWIEFHTWGIMTAAIPFSMAAVTTGSDRGAGNLAIAYQLGSIALLVGDLSTTVFKVPIRYCMLFFTICTFSIYLALLNPPGYHNAATAPFMIILFTFERFFEAHCLTTCYREIAGEFPLKYKEDASRALGICDQFSITLGVIVSTVIVAKVAHC